MSITEKTPHDPRFLYSPWRIDSTLMVVRHLIVQEGPKRIVVQRAPYDQFSEEPRRTEPLLYVERDVLERQGRYRKWIDADFGIFHRCPLGSLYATEPDANFDMRRWLHLLREGIKSHRAFLNLPLTEAVLREWFAEDGPESQNLKTRAVRLRPGLLPVDATHEPLSPRETVMPREVQNPRLRYEFRGGPYDGQVYEHPGAPDLEDPVIVYGYWRLIGEDGKEFAHLYDRTDESTPAGLRIYIYGGVRPYYSDKNKLHTL